MSIASEITRINTNIANSYTAVDNKNGTLPQVQNSANLASAINSIEVIEQATAEGESLSLTNTKAMPYSDYVVKGKSEQETRSGKNLAKLTGTAVAGISFIDSEISITGTFNNNTWQGFNSITLSAGTYTLSFISDFTNGTYFLFNNQQTTSKKVTITINETTNVSLGMVLFSGTYNNNIIKVQIEQGSTATSYEPYGVSPSPDYPSEIHSVADDVNLFNRETSENNKALVWTTGGTFNDTGSVVSDFISVEEGKTYVSKYYLQVILFDTNKNYIKQYNSTNVGVKQFDISGSNIAKYVKICFYSLSNNNIDFTQKNDLKLQKGSVSTPYSPYNQGTVTIKQRGKNLAYTGWAEDFVNSVNIPNQAYITTKDNKNCLRYAPSNGYGDYEHKNLSLGIKFKENTQYTISYDILKENYVERTIAFYYTDGTYTHNSNLPSTDIWVHQKLTSVAGKTVKYVAPFYTQGATYIDIDTYMINEGTEESAYEPYQGYDKAFQTEPLRSLPNGVKDTIEVDGIHRRVGRVVYDGTEDWYKRTDYYFENHTVFRNNSNRIHFIGNGYGLSNYFEVKQTQSEDNQIRLSSALTYGAQITTANNIASTPQELKTWLSTHNTELLYELEEETIEPFTQQQATTYLDIIKTGSYEGTTNIYTDEDVKPTIGVEYYKKS